MRLSSRLFWAALLVGAVLRVLVARSIGGRLDSDEAVVYLMARHGGGGPIFWGQSYGGTLLQQIAADLFRIFGPSVPLLQAVEVLWWLAAALLLRALGTRLWGAFVGDLAGALLWLPGPALLWITFRDSGFYGPSVALGFGTLLLALDDRKLSPLRALALGFVAGLAVWTSPMGAVFALPAAAFVLLRRRPQLVGMATGLVGFALGTLPLLVWKFNHSNPQPSLRTPLADLPHRTVEVVFRLLPAVWVDDSARAFIACLWVVLVLGGAVLAVARRSWTHLALASVAALSVVVIAGSNAILLPESLRYGALLAPVPFLLLAAGLGGLGRAKWLGWVLVLVLAGWTLQVSDRVTGGFRPAAGNHWEGEAGDLRRNGGDYVRAQEIDVPLLVDHLQEQGISAVYADYWVAYLIAAQSGEHVTADPLNLSRYQPYADRAAAAVNTAVVVFTGRDNDQLIRASKVLPPYTASQVAGFTVFVFDSQVPVELLPRYLY